MLAVRARLEHYGREFALISERQAAGRINPAAMWHTDEYSVARERLEAVAQAVHPPSQLDVRRGWSSYARVCQIWDIGSDGSNLEAVSSQAAREAARLNEKGTVGSNVRKALDRMRAQ